MSTMFTAAFAFDLIYAWNDALHGLNKEFNTLIKDPLRNNI
jgi:hypothetical protein